MGNIFGSQEIFQRVFSLQYKMGVNFKDIWLLLYFIGTDWNQIT